MWKTSKFLLFTCLLFLLCSHSPQPALAEPSSNATEYHLIQIQGQIKDAKTGQGLSQVYIRQLDSLNAAFSGPEGEFRLTLHSGFPLAVLFSKEGYEPIRLNFSQASQNLVINLQPLTRFDNPLPPAHTPEEPQDEGLFTSQFTAFYQGSQHSFLDPRVNIAGFALNEMGITSELLVFKPLTFRGRFYRGRLPINIADFPFQPAFFLNQLQAKIGAGYLWETSDNLEFYLGGDLLYHNQSPDNRNAQDREPIPFTSSSLDYEQSRLGVGMNGAFAWKLTDFLVIYPELTVYPAGLNFLRDQPQNPVRYMLAGDLGLKTRFEIVPGAYAVLQYNKQLWYGPGDQSFENNDYLHLGLSLDPWALSERLR